MLTASLLLLPFSCPPQETVRGMEVPESLAGEGFLALVETLENGASGRELFLELVEPAVRKEYDGSWDAILDQLEGLWNRFEPLEAWPRGAQRFGLVGRLAEDPTRAWREFFVEVNARGELTDMDVVAAPPPASYLEQPLDASGLVAELESLVAGLAENDLFWGSVLVARGDEILFQRAGGRASLRYDVPNRLETRFCLGSMTKLFTACAILRLVEEGQLALEDPLGRYLGESWLSPEAGTRIQVQHLLSHTGGTGDFFRHPDYPNRNRGHFRDVASFAEFISIQAPEFSPGSRHAYSNSGYILLGAILEAVTGEDYHDYMRRTFYLPLGMEDSDTYEVDSTARDLATGYYRGPGGVLRSNEFSQRARGCPAGSSYSTVGDLYRFARALRTGGVLGEEMLTQLVGPHPELGAEAYGFGVEHFGASPRIGAHGHSGGGPGVLARLSLYPQGDWLVVVLANHEQRAGLELALRIHELVARAEKL